MIREDVLQRMYDAGLEARYESMYDRVQYQRQRNRFNVAAEMPHLSLLKKPTGSFFMNGCTSGMNIS